MKASSSPLHEVAAAADLGPRVLAAATGELLVTKRGARVLGIYLDAVDENLLWVHPELADVDRARAHVAAGEWNLGGDRCWIAPEIELHFKNPDHPSHENYVVPADIDPGHYAVAAEQPAGVAFAAAGEASNLGSGKPFKFELHRSVAVCAPPVDVSGISYVGYSLSSQLTIDEPDRPDAAYGLWQLMQIPPGGRVYIAVHRPPEVVDYFGTGVAGHIQVERDHVIFPVTGTAQHKLGLRAADAVGLMGYCRSSRNGVATLIVRQAAVFPGACYADYPGNDRARRDIGLQFYNDSGAIGGFGEMEYHSVAATSDVFFETRDVSRTWGFAGPADRIADIGQTLLGVRPEIE